MSHQSPGGLPPVPFCWHLAEAAFYQEEGKTEEPHEVAVFVDRELDTEVAELQGSRTQLSFGCRCRLPYLVLQLRDMGKFLAFEIEVVDTDRRVRRIKVSNHQCTVRVSKDRASVPLKLQRGWNYICMDIEDMTEKAFGARFSFCRRVTLFATTRIARIFFQDMQYEDRQLPPWLRVLP